jgi:hypothetical protein
MPGIDDWYLCQEMKKIDNKVKVYFLAASESEHAMPVDNSGWLKYYSGVFDYLEIDSSLYSKINNKKLDIMMISNYYLKVCLRWFYSLNGFVICSTHIYTTAILTWYSFSSPDVLDLMACTFRLLYAASLFHIILYLYQRMLMPCLSSLFLTSLIIF